MQYLNIQTNITNLAKSVYLYFPHCTNKYPNRVANKNIFLYDFSMVEFETLWIDFVSQKSIHNK